MNNYEKLLANLEPSFFSGDDAIDSFDKLLDRIGEKRLTVLNRLLNGVCAFGGRVGFISDADYDSEDADENPFAATSDGCNGVFFEDDCWIYLRINLIKSWKMLEEVLAHETVHLMQSITYTGTRTEDDSAMSLCMDRIWAYDSEKYEAWMADLTDEDTPIYELEAYIEMERPRGVASSLEYLLNRPSLWANSYYCPVSAP